MEVPLVRPELVPKVQQGRRLRSSRLAQEVESIAVHKMLQLRDNMTLLMLPVLLQDSSNSKRASRVVEAAM